MAWWFLAALPILCVMQALASVGINLTDPATAKNQGTIILGFVALFASSAYAFAIVTLCVQWFFRWYFIAVGLTFGRTAMANRKETELVAAISAAERDGVA